MGKRVDLTGQRFGRLVVEGYSHTKNGKAFWLCKCDCGKCAIVRTCQLKGGRAKSCGCLMKEKTKTAHLKHGQSNTRLYAIWENMIARTNFAYSTVYDYYGGRGIKVCDEWRNDFQRFHDWAMENGYREELTIDRIDGSGDYCPENCRWVTMKEQNRNKKDIPKITYNGEMLTLAEWSERLGINKKTLWNRIHAYGWSIKEAFETPVKGK